MKRMGYCLLVFIAYVVSHGSETTFSLKKKNIIVRTSKPASKLMTFLRTTEVEGENYLLQVILWPLSSCCDSAAPSK